jgi:transcriptional regulator with XRE-family HTH domain
MKLKQFLQENNITLQQISRDLGVSKQYIWLVSNGRLNPSANLAQQISSYSKDKVAVREIRKCTSTCMRGCPCSKGE